MTEAAAQDAPSAAGLCPFCQCPAGTGDDCVPCPACGTSHHTDCWEENAGCGVYGCTRAPAVAGRRPVEVPVSYWGQERKPCPRCGESIMATALRCRNCGATFGSAQPQSADEAGRSEAARAGGPALRRSAVWLFVLCVLPLTAPLGVLAGLLWGRRRREQLVLQPAVYSALWRLGLGIGIAQTAFALVMVLLFWAWRVAA